MLLHFHPDWPFQGRTVIDGMASAGRYRSQFETGTSNGGLTAHFGGDRWRWESRLFRGRYDDGAAVERPVYGAVDLGSAHGAAPRFGSAYLRLMPAVSTRSSYCYPDSVFEPDGVRDDEGVHDLIARMRGDGGDILDRYVEAHVHGGVEFGADVEAIVLDPCFHGTPTHEAASQLGEVEFHPGFRVRTESLDPEYRGSEYVALARSFADELTPEVLGVAARSGDHDPQTIKRVWHLLARFGRGDDAEATAV